VHGQIYEIAGAGVGFWGRRLRHRLTSPAALPEEFIARVATFPVGVKRRQPGRQIEPWLFSVACAM